MYEPPRSAERRGRRGFVYEEDTYIIDQVTVDLLVNLVVCSSLEGQAEAAPERDERTFGADNTLESAVLSRPLAKMPAQEVVDGLEVDPL